MTSALLGRLLHHAQQLQHIEARRFREKLPVFELRVPWHFDNEMRDNGDPFAEELIRQIRLSSPEMVARFEEEWRKQSQNERKD